MSKAIDITTYHFAETDQLFFDANVWLYVYGPQGASSDYRSRIYSKAFSEVLRAKSKIWVDVLVISEFINSSTRMEFNNRFPRNDSRPDFKIFRNSPEFKPISEGISASVRNILKCSLRLESGFSSIDINALLSEFESMPSDFNDQILASLCLANSLMLVTHDSDFKGKGVNILTAHRKILN